VIPQTVAAAVAFLVFVAPGIHFELLRESRRPRLDQSSFQEAARIGLWSVAFSGSAVVIFAVARFWVPHGLPDPSEWALEGTSYVASHVALVGAFLVVEFSLALAIATLVHRSLNAPKGMARICGRALRKWLRHDPRREILPYSVWWAAFHARTPEQAEIHVSVRLKDGSVFTGKLGSFTTAGQDGDRDLALEAPVQVLRPGRVAVTLESPWHRLVLPGSEIHEIAVRWIREAA
jgi:hypothetical protein